MSDSADTSRAPSSASSSPAGSALLHPVGTVTSAVRQVPGAAVVREVFDGVLDTVGVVSPRARRVAAYAGVGLLGVAGVVEWPVAAAGAAVVWLTQPRAKSTDGDGARGARPAARKPTAGTARSGHATTRPAAKAAKTAKPSSAKPTKARATASASGRRPAGSRRTGSTSSTAGGQAS